MASQPHSERVERIVTDEYGSMTVRVISYEPAPGAAPPEAALAADVWQMVRFCCVGGSGYALNLLVFNTADGWMPYVPAFIAAFLVSALSNFVWNRLWTFPGGTGRAGHQLARFLTVSAGALGLDLLLLSGMVELATVPKLLAAAIAIAVVTPLSFLANKRWSFGSRTA